jgi:acyl carrier protein
MNNEKKLKEVFATSLGIDKNLVTDDLKYNSISEWDSVAHMTLIAAIEDEFDVMLDTDDIIDMSSFKKAKEILEKYGVK